MLPFDDEYTIIDVQSSFNTNQIIMISQLTSLDERAGTDLTGENNLDNVLERAGLNYNVEKVPMHTPEGGVVEGKYFILFKKFSFDIYSCNFPFFHTPDFWFPSNEVKVPCPFINPFTHSPL